MQKLAVWVLKEMKRIKNEKKFLTPFNQGLFNSKPRSVFVHSLIIV